MIKCVSKAKLVDSISN